MPNVKIETAPEVETIAKELIAECHPHLSEARILYVFTSQKRKSRGKIVYGEAKKFSPLQRFLSSGNSAVEDGYDFSITIWKEGWEEMSQATRRALVDHELCHCACDGDDEHGDPIWSLKAHDLEEFHCVVQRHGLWRHEIKAFHSTMKQMQLL